MSRTDAELVGDALTHLDVLHRHLARDGVDDDLVMDAVAMRLAAAIESLSNMTAAGREALVGAEWKAIWATRNRIAHGYVFADLDRIRDTVEFDLPDLERRLRSSLD